MTSPSSRHLSLQLSKPCRISARDRPLPYWRIGLGASSPLAMVSTASWRMQKHAWIAAMLAMVTAYADVVSLMRYHSFASILTGNVIMLCRAMVDPQTNLIRS